MSCDTPEQDGVIQIPDTLGLNFYNPLIEPPPPAPDNGRRIKLTWQVSRYYYDSTDGIRVRVVASDAALMPTKIFAYMMMPLVPGTPAKVGAFDHICSPVDLADYPEDAPIANSRPEWFRLNYVDVLLRSRAEVNAFIRDVAEDVQRLKATLDLNDDLLPGGTLWVGNPNQPPEVPVITVSEQPTNQTASGGAATFSVTASVTQSATLTYQWQRNPHGMTVFANISGATGASLVLSGLTNALNGGDTYRCVVSATGAAPVISNYVTLTVPAPDITISSQPSNQTASGGAATFAITASVTLGATLSYQWQRNPLGAGSFANITGATSASLVLSGLTNASNNGDTYKCVVSATDNATPVTSNVATLSVPVPGPLTSDLFIPVTTGGTITAITADCDGGGMFPSFDPDIQDYFVRQSASTGVAGLTLSVNGVDRTAEVTTDAAVNMCMYVTADAQEYFIKIIPATLPIATVVAKTSDYIPGYYLVVPSDGYAEGQHCVVYNQYGVPIWYTTSPSQPISLHTGYQRNRLVTNGWHNQDRYVLQLSENTLETVGTYNMLNPDSRDTNHVIDVHETMEIAAPIERRGNLIYVAYTNGFYIQEQTPEHTIEWEWWSIDSFSATDPEFFHANSVDVHPVTGNILVSCRTHGVVFCIDYQTKDVIWAIDTYGSLAAVTTQINPIKFLTPVNDEYSGIDGQHDARWHMDIVPITGGNDTVSIFDDRSDHGVGVANGVIYEIDLTGATAICRSRIKGASVVPFQGSYTVIKEANDSFTHTINYVTLTPRMIEYKGNVNGLGTQTQTFVLNFAESGGNPYEYRVVKARSDFFDVNVLRTTAGRDIVPVAPPGPPVLYTAPTENSNVTVVSHHSPFTTGGGSYYFDGTGYLRLAASPNWALGTGDFTIEWFQYQTTHDSYPRVFQVGRYQQGISIGCNFNLTGEFDVWTPGVSASGFDSFTVGDVTEAWQHFAIVRRNSELHVYKNGVQVGVMANSADVTNSTTDLYIGCEGVTPDTFFTGYITNFRLVKGVAVYTGDFTVPTSALTATAGANPYGGVNTQAIPADHTGLLLVPVPEPVPSEAFNFGGEVNDWTIESWIYPLQVENGSTYYLLFDNRLFFNSGFGLYLSNDPAAGAPPGALGIYDEHTGPGPFSAPVVNYNAWNHIAVVRSGTTITYYINGVNSGAGTFTCSPNTSGVIGVFTQKDISFGHGWLGYIDDFRITKTALYSGAYVLPPQEELTALPDTVLLLNFNADVSDSSPLADTITVYGVAPVIQSGVAKFGSSAYFTSAGYLSVTAGT